MHLRQAPCCLSRNAAAIRSDRVQPPGTRLGVMAPLRRRNQREKIMAIKKALLAACAAATLISGTALAQPGWVPPGNDPNGYYSDTDHNGYYDRDGRYHRIRYRD